MPNPDWDRSDHRNVHALIAIFGFHCVLHIASISIVYLLVYGIVWVLQGGRVAMPAMPWRKTTSDNESYKPLTA